MMKRRVAKGICLLSVLGMLIGTAACSTQGPAVAGQAGKSVKGGGANIKNVSIWHMWTSDTDSNKASFEAAAEKFSLENPDIKLNPEVVETEIYKSKIRMAVAANEAPDVFFSWGGGFSRAFVDSGKVLDVYSYLDPDTKSRLPQSALDYQTYNGKVYGLPFMISITSLFANKEMFGQNGIKLPETFEELLAAVKAFRQKGITPINVAEIELWPGMLWYDVLALGTAGSEACLAALDKKASFDRPAFREAAEKLIELVDAGAFQQDCMKTGYGGAMEPVRRGKVPMILMGSWACSGFENATSDVRGKIVPLEISSIAGGKEGPDEYVGGAIDCWMVSANTPDRTASVKVAAAIAEGMCAEGYERNMLIPVWKLSVDGSGVSPLMKRIEEMVSEADGFVPSWDTFLEGADAQTHLRLVAGLFSRTVTPGEFAAGMQKLNEKVQNK